MAALGMARSSPVLRSGRIGTKVAVARPTVAKRTPRGIATRASDDEALTRGALGELTATGLFQLIGSAAAVTGAGAAIGANSLGLTALIYAFANISGGHMNPAVSFMLLLQGKIDLKKFLVYAAAQARCHLALRLAPAPAPAHSSPQDNRITGAVLACLLLTWLIPGVSVGMGAAGPGAWAPAAKLGAGAIFGWELIFTAFLCLTVYSTAVAKPGFGNAAPIGIGLVVLAAALSAGELSGAIINPARALGPALVFQNLAAGTVALYLAAHFAGAALAATLAKVFYGEEPGASLKAALS